MFDFTILEIFMNLGLAAFLGLVIGIERAIAGKTAGMRTFALVSLGSSLFVTISVIVTNEYLGHVTFDPMRTLSAVISGIGFLGAGLILFRNDALRGLTTAAGLWTSAGIGAAVGFGLYSIAIFVTLLLLLIFTAVWFIETKIKFFVRKGEPVTLEKLTTTEEDIDE